MRTPWLFVLATLCGCPSQVGVISQDPNAPTESNATTSRAVPNPGAQLEDDERVIEPDHPAVKTPQERALAHVHTPGDVCSGVVIAPRLVATAHQCFAQDVSGVYAIPAKDKDSYKVEIASSTLTWTTRKVVSVVAPACAWNGLDLAILVLDEDAPPLAQPVAVTTAPSPGGQVQALGFGRCRGDDKPFSSRTGSVVTRKDKAISIDVNLCQGDVGGPVFDTSANGYVGVISGHGQTAEDQEHVAIVRFDHPRARDLVALASSVVKGDSPKSAVACD